MLAHANGSPGRYQLLATVILAAALLLGTLPLSLRWLALWTAPSVSPTADHRLFPDFSALPLQFEPNVGQTDPSARYLAHAPGGMLYFTPSGVVMSFRGLGAGSLQSQRLGIGPQAEPVPDPRSLEGVIRLRFMDANPAPEIESGAALPGKVNYLIGNDPAHWHTALPTYQDITYAGLYPGIDVSYAGHAGLLKSTFSLAPGSDPSRIRWRYDGAGQVQVDAAGNLLIKVSGTRYRVPSGPGSDLVLTEQAPTAWQEIGAGAERRRVAVSAHYSVSGDGTIGIVLSSYDRSVPLVVDPPLTYSSYLGGSGDDVGYGVAVDGSGDVYLTGETVSTDFPTTDPFQPTNHGATDAFIAKVNADGSALVYSTYLGGSGSDNGLRIIVDGSEDAYVVGATSSTNYPTQNPIRPAYGGGTFDAFVTKLNPSGSALVYSTYLGGSDADYGAGLGLDDAGNLYVSGETGSPNFPLRNPYQPALRGFVDVFVCKINPSGSDFVYSTYFGSDGSDEGFALAVDTAGNVYLTGATNGFGLPLMNAIQPFYAGGSYDAFITKINSAGTGLAFSTYFGGNDNDVAWGIAVDATGNVYLDGYTSSTNFPTANPIQPTNHGVYDLFVSRLNPAGTSLTYSTYLGGSSSELGAPPINGIAIDGQGSAYVVGTSYSTDFPTADPIQPSKSGGSDVVVAKLNPGGSALVYSTYLGGGGDDGGFGVAVDGAGNAYLTGRTASLNFPTANPFQPASGGGDDAFIAKISNAPVPPTGTSTHTPTITPTRTSTRTYTPTPTRTPTNTRTHTPTNTPTNTPTFTPTSTATATFTSTSTATATATQTHTATPCPMTFSDVQTSDYFYVPVRYLYCRGVISGYGDNTFRPYNNTTRGQLVKIIVLAYGFPIYTPQTPTFRDVSGGDTFYQYIETAAHVNLISGYVCGTGCLEFRPGNNVTRGQLSKIVVIAAEWTLRDPPAPSFQDVPTNHPFYTFIETAYCHGIFDGYNCGTGCLEFRPGNNATRGQISKIVYEARAGGHPCQ